MCCAEIGPRRAPGSHGEAMAAAHVVNQGHADHPATMHKSMHTHSQDVLLLFRLKPRRNAMHAPVRAQIWALITHRSP